MEAVMSPGGYMVVALGGASADAVEAVRSRADLAMERYAEGDRAAGELLYGLLWSRLYAIGFRWTRSASAAEDLVQDTFLKLTEARGTFRRGAPILPWACTMARNLLTDRNRRGAFERWVADACLRLEEDAEGGREADDERPDHRRRLQATAEDLSRLPAPQREAFTLIRVDGLSVKQAARRLGITEGMVKIRTFRAAAALRASDERRRRDA